ncbi:MAG: ATP-binding cassette domain-containing protein [Rickettsiales bacterium]|nr:ATP-binding cassette domain-containing protein [Rickettsiales bacterium]
MSETPKIQITDLHKSFASKQVLRGIDLEVAKGESLVIIGGSGSGKSVLLKNVLGLMPPTSGTILVDGESPHNMSNRKRMRYMSKFGMLFQGGALFDSIPVWQNITFAPFFNGGMDKDTAYKLAVEKLEQVGLSEREADAFPAELSGGMQKRVALARAICGDPEIIFFDEPTTGLDPIMADVINDLIVKCTKELGSTTMTITHDMQSAVKIADKVAMLYQGEIIWQGKAKEVYASKNPYVDQFVHGRADGPITDDNAKAGIGDVETVKNEPADKEEA